MMRRGQSGGKKRSVSAIASQGKTPIRKRYAFARWKRRRTRNAAARVLFHRRRGAARRSRASPP
jgi:hypothetical protein